MFLRQPKAALTPTEALAAGAAILPPNPGHAPLATTVEDAGGVGIPPNTPVADASVPTLVPDEGLMLDGVDKKPVVSSLQPTSSRTSVSPQPSAPPPREKALSTARLVLVTAIVTCTMCMNAGGSMSLNIALPAIQTDLNMLETDLQWVASAYTLTSGCLLLLSGRMADVHGRKLVFICGLVWYAIWCLVAGFMNTGAGLVVTRALAGSGAAMSVPSAIGIIAANFSGRSRSTAFAAFAAGAPVGGGIGLVLGGLLTAYAPTTWRGSLWVFAGLAFGIAAAAFFFVPEDSSQTVDKRIDWVGAALVTVGLILLQFVVSDGESAPHGWRTGYIIALLIFSVLTIAAFFFWEHHVIHRTSRPPLIRLKLFTRSKGRLAAVYFIGFTAWMGFVSLLYHATLYYQQVQNTGPIGAMLRFLPTTVSGVLCNVLVAKLVARVPTQWIVCTGILASGLASVLMALSGEDTLYWRLPFQAMWMSVMGADFLMATGSIFVSALALPEEQSVAGALFQTLVQLGGAFGLAVTTVISDSYQNKALAAGKSATDAILDGLHAAFWLGGGCSFIALILALVMLRGMGAIGNGVKESPGKEIKEQEALERRTVGEEKV